MLIDAVNLSVLDEQKKNREKKAFLLRSIACLSTTLSLCALRSVFRSLLSCFSWHSLRYLFHFSVSHHLAVVLFFLYDFVHYFHSSVISTRNPSYIHTLYAFSNILPKHEHTQSELETERAILVRLYSVCLLCGTRKNCLCIIKANTNGEKKKRKKNREKKTNKSP